MILSGKKKYKKSQHWTHSWLVLEDLLDQQDFNTHMPTHGARSRGWNRTDAKPPPPRLVTVPQKTAPWDLNRMGMHQHVNMSYQLSE